MLESKDLISDEKDIFKTQRVGLGVGYCLALGGMVGKSFNNMDLASSL